MKGMALLVPSNKALALHVRAYHPQVAPRLQLRIDSKPSLPLVQLQAWSGGQLHIGGQAHGNHHMVRGKLGGKKKKNNNKQHGQNKPGNFWILRSYKNDVFFFFYSIYFSM